MRTNKTKEQFITDTKKEIKAREELCKIYDNIVMTTLNKFNGKVLNKRLTTAIQEQLPQYYFIREEYQNGCSEEYQNGCSIEYTLNRRNDDNYLILAALSFKIIVSRDDFRIESDKSKSEYYTIKWRENFEKHTEELRDSIKKYLSYMKKAEKLEAMIRDFNKLPLAFRLNMNKYDLCLFL